MIYLPMVYFEGIIMMKKIVYKSKAIQAVIMILAVVLLISLWPLRLWQETVSTSIPLETGTVTQVVDNNMTVLQSFVAQYDHMGSLRLYLGEETEGESFFVRILDEGQVMIAEEEIAIDAANLPGYVEVLVDVDMEVGKMYHCIVQGNDSHVYLACEQIPMTDMPYAGVMYYNNQPLDGTNLVAEYEYSVPLRKGKVLLFGGTVVVLAALLLAVVKLIYKKKNRDKLITVERAFRFVANPVAAAFILIGLGAVVMGAFGNYVLDNTVFFISFLFLAGILFYGINHNRDGQNAIFSEGYLSNHLPDLFQSICIAGAIWACCEYMNGLYDIHHAVAERKEMIWFALAVIAMFKWKEIFNLYNLVYVIAAGIGGYFYYQNEVLKLAEQTIKETEIGMHLQIIQNTVVIAILLGLIIIRTIIGLCKRKLARPDFWYAGLLTVFFAAIIIFRNGRWWTVALAVSFTLFYLTYGMWEKKERLLVNICRGIALQFILATGYALLHRPFVTYKTARYPHIFHTVTITATYLTIVECAAIVLLLTKFATSKKLKDIWKELCFFGVVSSYMMFTMARTGFLAVAVTLLAALLIMTAGKGKEWFMNLLQAIGWMTVAVIVCLPVTFTAQRSVPAIASDPILFEIESYPDEVMRGQKLSSMQFMRVGRFIDVFSEKIFNIPEGTFDVYGEIAEYRRTHDIAGDDIDPADTEAISIDDVATGKVDISEAHEATHHDMAEEDMEEDPFEIQVSEEDSDYTNGRIDIFRSYLEQLNMKGHAEMGAVLPDGAIATHAHDVYLQVAYDHGIPTGILFVLVGLLTWIRAFVYYKRRKNKTTYAALPIVVTTAVAAAGVVEWIFHLSNPCGLVLMLVITPLVFHEEV